VQCVFFGSLRFVARIMSKRDFFCLACANGYSPAPLRARNNEVKIALASGEALRRKGAAQRGVAAKALPSPAAAPNLQDLVLARARGAPALLL
jgi:hypothetical protein